MPDDELGWQLCTQLEVVTERTSNEMQNAGDLFRDVRREIGAWFRKRGHPLNALAQVLWHFARHGDAGASDSRAWLSEALTRWAECTVKKAATYGPTLLWTFVVRAQGHTLHGESVRWNPKPKRFENVPWSLRKRFQKKAPANATVIEHRQVRYAAPLPSLCLAAKQSGYRVRENRAFTGPPDEGTVVLHSGSHSRERRKGGACAVDVAAEAEPVRRSLPHGGGM